MSAEQTSQTYFTPPSPALVAIFFLMTPMVGYIARWRCGDGYPGTGNSISGVKRDAKKRSVNS
jgi:hypothetical protein